MEQHILIFGKFKYCHIRDLVWIRVSFFLHHVGVYTPLMFMSNVIIYCCILEEALQTWFLFMIFERKLITMDANTIVPLHFYLFSFSTYGCITITWIVDCIAITWIVFLVIVKSGNYYCRNLPFGGKATRHSQVRLPRKENARSRHQGLFEEKKMLEKPKEVYEF